jgi:MoxR-like ATPase
MTLTLGYRSEQVSYDDDAGEWSRFQSNLAALVDNVQRVVVAERETIRFSLLALFTESHVLLEDLPSVGKTLLAKTIARSIEGKFTHIQFTPDLLPTDITGTSVFDLNSNRFEFIPGPIFANVVLADELNRAGPRTQSALLEAMGERQVSADGSMPSLPKPFLVIATQNYAESHGTFPLPYFQLDPFTPAQLIDRAVSPKAFHYDSNLLFRRVLPSRG